MDSLRMRATIHIVRSVVEAVGQVWGNLVCLYWESAFPLQRRQALVFLVSLLSTRGCL